MTETEIETEKKSERMEIRLGHTEKQSFLQACESQGDTPSDALRRFIDGYSRRANSDLRASAFREMRHSGRLSGWRFPAAIVGAVFALSVLWAGSMPSQSYIVGSEAYVAAQDEMTPDPVEASGSEPIEGMGVDTENDIAEPESEPTDWVDIDPEMDSPE